MSQLSLYRCPWMCHRQEELHKGNDQLFVRYAALHAAYHWRSELSSCCTNLMKSTGYETDVSTTKCNLREKTLSTQWVAVCVGRTFFKVFLPSTPKVKMPLTPSFRGADGRI